MSILQEHRTAADGCRAATFTLPSLTQTSVDSPDGEGAAAQMHRINREKKKTPLQLKSSYGDQSCEEAVETAALQRCGEVAVFW